MLDPKPYLDIAKSLMSELHIQIRDTYSDNYNWDDFYANGRMYNGPRRLTIVWDDSVPFAALTGGTLYQIENFNSVAWDNRTIRVPTRFQNGERDDALVHECVHFLQHTTKAEERSYISINKEQTNWLFYFGQRVELEAHLVQVAYTQRENPSRWRTHIGPEWRDELERQLDKCRKGYDYKTALPLVVRCKELGLL